jgi:hypothetical protein
MKTAQERYEERAGFIAYLYRDSDEATRAAMTLDGLRYMAVEIAREVAAIPGDAYWVAALREAIGAQDLAQAEVDRIKADQ